MTRDYYEYIGSVVKVVDQENDSFVGKIIGYEVGAIEDREYDSIDIQQDGGYCISVPIPYIISFELID